MSPNAQRVEIAAACGWTHDHINARAMFYDLSTDSHVGDPLNDLNAMHEAEKVMNPGEQFHYSSIIIRILGHEENGLVELSDFDLLHATAAQRAEAFLRAIGKWEEQP